MPEPTSSPHSDPMDLLHEPGHLIRRAHQRAVSVFHDTHGRDVTPVQYALLRALDKDPGIDQVTLAERVALDTSTTADIAARMEKKGWIRRELLARRQRSLHLTSEGQALLAAMLPRVDPMYEQLLSSLTPSERQQLLGLLQKLVGLASPEDAG
ncbi:MarR family transcriptional regulator [Hydrogenophaga sp. 5NK40-0174]|uniref:MarR family winged helix-turn-helix transcriptional regulator n=1 Tax=Hydrogenophaga sp. 5NK40-0174 TaxID=3127649 RepID=UPI00310858CE